MTEIKEFCPNIRIQNLTLEKIPELVIPFSIDEKRISLFSYFSKQNSLDTLSVLLKPTYQTKIYETDKRLVTSQQIGNYTVTLTLNTFVQVSFLNNHNIIETLSWTPQWWLSNNRWTRTAIWVWAKVIDLYGKAAVIFDKLFVYESLILIAGYRTIATDESADDPFGQKFKKEKITTILLVNLSGIPLGSSFDFCSSSKDQQVLIQPSIDGIPKEKCNLLFCGGFKLSVNFSLVS
jgi:hypothetical protein